MGAEVSLCSECVGDYLTERIYVRAAAARSHMTGSVSCATPDISTMMRFLSHMTT